jgi:hypothetical protein
MTDLLAVNKLLCKLQGEPPDHDIARQLCEMAKSLANDCHYEEAIEIAQQAWQLARDGPDGNRHGMTLLYLSYVRSRCESPDQHQQAIRDCDEAIAIFDLPLNCAIAEIVRAQIELDMLHGNHDSKGRVLAHLQRAAQILQEEASAWHAPSGQRHEDRELLAEVKAKISELVGTVTTGSLFELSVPIPLVWPGLGAICFQFVSTYSVVAGDQSSMDSKPDDAAVDYMEVSRLSLGGKLYDVHAWNTVSNESGILRLRPNGRYIAFEIDSQEDRARYSNWHVLARKQARLDQTGQEVVITDSTNKRIWIDLDTAELKPPRFIGGIDDTPIEGSGERTQVSKVIGTVEAIARPVRLS